MAKILLVEDEPEIAEITARTLRGLGYQFAGLAVSGEAAIRAVQASQPSLVLMDIGLAGPIDGIETASRLTQKYDLPVVFLTAAHDETTLERAKAAGPYGYLVKPFEPRNLHAAITMALSQHESAKQRIMEVRAQTERDFRMKFAHAVAAMFQAGSSGEILQTNPALARLLGYDSPQDLAASVKRLNQVLNLDVAAAHGLAGSQKPGASVKSFALDAYRKDGSTIWVSGSIRVIRNPAGEIQFYEGNIAPVANAG